MSLLTLFNPPAGLQELVDESLQAWSKFVGFHTGEFASRFPQYYDPVATDTPDDLTPSLIAWSAFPARLVNLPDATRWQRADADRDEQDEYCEWVTARDSDGKVTGVTFTTEVPEYWSHLAGHDPSSLLVLYRELVDPSVQLSDLIDGDGEYLRRNRWNRTGVPGITHLQQPTNTLLAALDLVANATILRHINGQLVTDRQQLVSCGRLGDPRRNSDPQIAEVVNDAAALGAEITLADPIALYLDGLQSGGILAPDGADATTFWTVERGTAERAVRASFEVPDERGYTVGDLTIHGRPVKWGAQVADKVRVRIAAFVRPGAHQPVPQPCVG